MNSTVKVETLLVLLFDGDTTCEELVEDFEFSEEELEELEEFLSSETALWNYIVEYNGVPFDGDEDDYDNIIAGIEEKLSPGYEVYKDILRLC